MTMRMSAAGRAALIEREGCRLTAYRDSVGVWTIGVGHTGRASPPPVVPGMPVTPAESAAVLRAARAPFEAVVNRSVVVPVGQNAFDAMVSLAFNIGAEGFAGSTVVRKLNAGDRAGAADAFLMWNRPPELRGRRMAERLQFLAAAAPVLVGGDGAPAPGRSSWLRRLWRGLTFGGAPRS